MKHVLSVKQFTDKALLYKLFKRASELEDMPPADYPKPLRYLTLATIFFEPSTRTRLSFETAIQNLGGQLVTVENAGEFSSAKKGESLEDTIKTLNAYVDGIIMRHPDIGSAKRAAAVSRVPIINGGDGGGDHPTQALYDVYSIQKDKGRIDGLKIAIVGDLLHSRALRSVLELLANFNVEFFLISPPALKLSKDQIKYFQDRKIKIEEMDSWQSVIADLDVIYINRIQKERFKLEEEYQLLKNSYILTPESVKQMKKDAIILDPLPRVNEIAIEVDNDPRARYFEQVKNGLYVRMALLELIFSN